MRRTLTLVVTTVGVLVAPAAAMAVNDPAGTADAVGESDPCAMGMFWSALLTAGFVGEPTPHAALEAFLAWPAEARVFTPPPGEPRLLGAANTTRFDWTDDDGTVVATVGLATNGNGWVVNSGMVCLPG